MPATPGDALRQARERAGLTQDDIAAKLKLSPRQISAIETGDWSALPERTFTRGFMRSYARLVSIDPDSLGLDQAPSQPHAASELKPTPEAIGEIAHEADHNAFGAARLLVPGLLIAALLAGVLYFQGGNWFGWDIAKLSGNSVSPQPPKSSAAAKPDPAVEKEAAPAPTAATSSGAVIAPAASTAPDAPAATSPGAPLNLVADATVSATPAAAAAAPALTPSLLNPAEKRISLVFKGKSWTEVRSKGEVIFSETAQPGTREFSGALPLSFTVGNASNVAVLIDGKPYDMSEITRNDVARFRVE
jgi:cytoskeleton protein RodZ